MVKLAVLGLVAFAAFQEIPICRPLKEDESYVLKTLLTLRTASFKVSMDGTYEHKCLEVDDHGVQHVEAKCLDGTMKVDDQEPESMKGESFNYFQNSYGQQFEYEDIRLTLKDEPGNFLIQEIHSKLKDDTVVGGETWKDKSAHTTYTITAGQPKKFHDVECIEVIRKGSFTDGVSGEFKEDSWYRVKDGQLIYQMTTADDVTMEGKEPLQILERNEFVEQK